MPAVSRVDPKTYFSDAEWRSLAVRSSWRGLLLVAHAWIVIFAAMAVWYPIITRPVSYTQLTLPTTTQGCRTPGSPYH